MLQTNKLLKILLKLGSSKEGKAVSGKFLAIGCLNWRYKSDERAHIEDKHLESAETAGHLYAGWSIPSAGTRSQQRIPLLVGAESMPG